MLNRFRTALGTWAWCDQNERLYSLISFPLLEWALARETTEAIMAAQWLLSLVILACAIPCVQSSAQQRQLSAPELRVLSFNILQGGADASNVGFANEQFGGSRLDEIVDVIRLSKADIVCVQEDASGSQLLDQLGHGWHRVGSIYSKFKMEALHEADWLHAARVQVNKDHKVVVVNCHWSPSDYGPFLIQEQLKENGLPSDLERFERDILKRVDKTNAPRGYEATLKLLRPFIESGQDVVLAGDFNEPSHLDWTTSYKNQGKDRWVKNSTSITLRFEIAWQGSQLLEEIGMHDAYRTYLPDEVNKPGNTWTPPYPNGTKGRRDYDDQVLDRIDRLYFIGESLDLLDAAVVGESDATCEIAFHGRWPSDHRAVVAEFRLRTPD